MTSDDNFEDAFVPTLRRHVRVVSPIVGSVSDAEAVVQDAFLQAFTRWRRISRYDRPGAWVRRVAIRDAVRFAERARRRPPVEAEGGDPVDPVAVRLDLEAALRRLPPRQRACVVLHHLADWPVAAVAEALGCAEPTVRVHLHRARGALAVMLAPDRQETNDGR